ncbi:GntR family transcriptional regulator [Streptomyces sp. JH002]|uniref:GntR family transcriptional regulator n=1 Tax=Streptomyces sp. JH002 TaxID=2763259 RepID=UPI003D803675
MLIRIDPASSRPLSAQIAASVRRALTAGELRTGDRLPAARDVARSLGINMHTVLKGYQDLKAEGLIDLRPGRGAVVTVAAPRSRARLLEAGHHLVALARESGMSDEETLELVRECLAPAVPPPPSSTGSSSTGPA